MACASDVSSSIEAQFSGCSECSSPTSVSDQLQINRGSCNKWKKVMKKMIEGSRKSIYGSSKPLKFRYDAVIF
ncbi:hypothetical protein E3N88_20412 [Mikania micrantha]|uniref:Uncharacterized protein n=1 Tax=Mikania micrantha TaxID=192012 RepID=A0A5N6NI38_9ASTR|nr:hypothetical protein E3N88_20412 [Mikania micrantha]